LVVYTAIIGPYDDLRDPIVGAGACRYVCFTDQPFVSARWDVRPPAFADQDPRRCAKRHKIFPHLIFPGWEYSLWVDGQFRVVAPPETLIGRCLSDHDVALFRHPERDCVYHEGAVCSARRLDDPAKIRRHMAAYRAEGYPPHSGLVASGVILRRHTDACAALSDSWWPEIQRFDSRRDQLSFNHASRSTGVGYAGLPGACFVNDYFTCHPHRRPR
jgi:hypothetical protein